MYVTCSDKRDLIAKINLLFIGIFDMVQTQSVYSECSSNLVFIYTSLLLLYTRNF